jgi:hypothetical protein
MNKLISLCWLLLALSACLEAQSLKKLPESALKLREVEADLRFLASDELQGRKTGEPGNLKAATFIAERFRHLGLQSFPDAPDFFQQIAFLKILPAKQGSVSMLGQSFQQGTDLIMFSAAPLQGNFPLVFGKYAWADEEAGTDDLEGLELAGKMVVARVGFPGARSPFELIAASRKKLARIQELGGVGLIELYTFQVPLSFLMNYFTEERLEMEGQNGNADNQFFHAWVNDPTSDLQKEIRALENTDFNLTCQVPGHKVEKVMSPNVIGYVEGTDPKLKDEFVAITAHYDHIGTGGAAEDTIYNGARDNAFGTVALLAAAKSLQKIKPKRSVVFIALTGEEIGLLGSRFYVENPLIPLQQTVFCLNTDGAGYTDTQLVSVIGLDRVGAREEIIAGCAAFGLQVFADPAPEQQLFDRSDNVSFAQNGIPAPTFSPGFKTFDQEIARHYHQVSDEANTIDFNYLLKFCQAFAHSARLIANKTERPFWRPGDVYEAAGRNLYNLD